MKVRVEKNEIVDFLFDYIDLEEVRLGFAGLKQIDWNPFDDDGDEYASPWSEIKHNWELAWAAAVAFAHTIERVLIGGEELTDPQKHEVVVAALDRAIKAPWYIEPFDGMVLDMLVKGVVTYLNAMDWIVDDDDDNGPIELTEFVEVGG